MVFVKNKNKWSEFDGWWNCCSNKCINTKNPIGNCIEGNGFVNIISDENIKYVNFSEWKDGRDQCASVYAKNSFNKTLCLNYLLYYFEIKCKLEGELNKDGKWMYIGLKNMNTSNKYIEYSADEAIIINRAAKETKKEIFKLSTSFNNNDIYGCGLVYPPTNKLNEEFPYVFFTQNGKQISNGLLLKDHSDSYKPYVWLRCCSVEANFGSNLEIKPFKYDISKHSILKEFY